MSRSGCGRSTATRTALSDLKSIFPVRVAHDSRHRGFPVVQHNLPEEPEQPDVEGPHWLFARPEVSEFVSVVAEQGHEHVEAVLCVCPLLEGQPLVSGYKVERVEPYAELVCGPGAGDANNLDTFVELTTFAPPDFKPTFSAG